MGVRGIRLKLHIAIYPFVHRTLKLKYMGDFFDLRYSDSTNSILLGSCEYPCWCDCINWGMYSPIITRSYPFASGEGNLVQIN